jgi:hypothetical protein
VSDRRPEATEPDLFEFADKLTKIVGGPERARRPRRSRKPKEDKVESLRDRLAKDGDVYEDESSDGEER